jgi:hypothetical protein
MVGYSLERGGGGREGGGLPYGLTLPLFTLTTSPVKLVAATPLGSFALALVLFLQDA